MTDEHYGFTGKILRVNLTQGRVTIQDHPKELMRGYLGGRGTNIRIIWDEVGVDTDPLGPDNLVVFGAGPLVGTLAPSSGRWNVSSRSPMTGLIGDSNAGGHWAAELKWSGFDNVVFSGRSEKPVYLWINDGEAELRDAKGVWGKGLTETTSRIREEVDEEEAKVAAIGPAGENLVQGAAVISDLTRAAGRTGIAAVMGTKNIKGIAVVGTKSVNIADSDRFMTLMQEATNEILEHPLYEVWATLGTTFLLRAISKAGRLAIKNWSENVLDEDDAWELSGRRLFDDYSLKNKGCYNCPIACSRVYSIEDGPYAGTLSEGPEYEAQTHLGSNLGIYDIEAMLHLNALCNDLGLDVCTVGATIAWAMECYERGIITDEDTGGLKLNWGNDEAAVDLVKKMAYREGFGDVIADGSYAASERLGKGSEYLIVTKKLPWTAVDARGSFGWALAYATSTRGADHLRSLVYVSSLKTYQDQATKLFGVPPEATDEWSLQGKPFFVKYCEEVGGVIDAIGICKTPSMILMTDSYFVSASGKPDKLAEIITATTGIPYTGTSLLQVGERIYNTEKAFNTRFGLGRRSLDTTPRRFMEDIPPKEPRHTEDALVTPEKLNQLLDEYYELRGWDVQTGLIKRQKLEELGLKRIADELESLGELPS
ncbi:MAG: aldehyde ferredoxin oxidoreductase family protein [Candidatus Thorarchaeota archaeon]